MKKLILKKSLNLSDIESILKDSDDLKSKEELKIVLPRKSSLVYFKDTWMYLMVCSFGMKNSLTIIDYSHEKSDEGKFKSIRFIISRPVGIAVFHYSKIVKNLINEPLKFNKNELYKYLSNPLSFIEFQKGNEVVFFSYDSVQEYPVQFEFVDKENGRMIYLSWLKQFTKICGDLFGVEIFPSASIENRAFCRVIFETFENSRKWGRLKKLVDSEGNYKIREGPRYFSIKKHINKNREISISAADSFSELKKYLYRIFATNNNIFRFMEISISDSGEGVVGWFRYKNDFTADLTDTEILNYIVNNRATTDADDEYAGLGFEKIINAVFRIDGFLSIRCNSTWVYFDRSCIKRKNRNLVRIESEDINLFLVKTIQPLMEIKGTHINILMPITN